MVKYIFCVNTGRSGSHYLSNVLDKMGNCDSYHEAPPILVGKPMLDFLKGNELSLDKLMPEKIASISSKSKPGRVYVETNHSFIKGFGWKIPSYIPQDVIGVIFLRRDKGEIISSLKRIGMSPLYRWGKNFLLPPTMKNPTNRIRRSTLMVFIFGYWFMRVINNRVTKKLFNNYVPAIISRNEDLLLEWYVDETQSMGAEA